MGNQGITEIFKLITQLLPAFRGKIIKYTKKNLNSKIIDIAHCKTYTKHLLDVECAVLIRCYYQTTITKALYESTDEHVTQPTDN
jgi:hypothetical protein